MAINALHLRWSLARMAKVIRIWDHKLDRIDKEYILRRIRDKEPALFFQIAREPRP